MTITNVPISGKTTVDQGNFSNDTTLNAQFSASCAAIRIKNSTDSSEFTNLTIRTRQTTMGLNRLSMYSGAIKARKDALPVCVAQNAQNQAVTLRGNQNSGFFRGAFWSTGTSGTVGGGSVISYVSDDRSTIVAQGTNIHDTGLILAPNKDAVAFRLTAKCNPTGTSIAFSNLERASEVTGQMAD